jgi:carbon monoxide dehydrogenase subunit G
MRLEGEIEIAGSVEEVWKIFMDPALLCRITPGCESARQVDETHYEASLAVKVQFMTVKAQLRGELLQAEEPRLLIFEVVGETRVMAGAFRALATVELTPQDGRTRVHYDFDTTLLGRLGNLGEPLVRSTARKFANKFAANVSGLFQAGDSQLRAI